jgi:hypothetical protein
MAKTISVFLVSLFMVYMVTPTIVTILDNNFVYSYIYSIAEEEHNGEERKFSEKPSKILSKFFSYAFLISDYYKNITPDFHLNHWSAVYFELHIPPPEQV